MIHGGKAGEDGTLTVSRGGTLFSPQTLGDISITEHVSDTNCVRSCGATGITNRNEMRLEGFQTCGTKEPSKGARLEQSQALPPAGH